MAARVLLPITRLSAMLDARETDSVALTRAHLERIAGPGKALNAFITVMAASALAEARHAAGRAAAGRRLGPLDGIPIALKDNIDVAGVPTSNGLGGAPWRIPTEDAEVVRRLREAGAVILGKLNMHEGALGATNDNPHHGRAINPYRAGYSPGGSSGGSGVAVAAGLCCAALGTDTGGSVRIPASWCGIVGLKPSYGLISTRGVVPLSYRLDHTGALTRTVADAAIMLGVLGGFDPGSPESRHGPNVRPDTLKRGRLDNVRLGVLGNYAAEPVEADITAAFNATLAHLTRLGAEIRIVDLPTYDVVQGRRAGFVRVEAEAAFVHGPLYGKEPERFSAEMRRYLDYGAKMPARQLLTADRRIDVAAFELTQCFEGMDAIVSPTTPQTAPMFGGARPDSAGAFCILANFAGCPAISVPMGCNEMGLPMGLQIIGMHHGDAQVLEIAASYEAVAGINIKPPPFSDIRA